MLLTLVLSLQASYAAPLILLAQNRQERRDRSQAEIDRRVVERTQADTEYLAREIASIRLSLNDVATTSELERPARAGHGGDRADGRTPRGARAARAKGADDPDLGALSDR